MLEHILEGTEKPTNLPFALLKKITDDFSEEREIGQGGFGTVYKVILLSKGNSVYSTYYPKYLKDSDVSPKEQSTIFFLPQVQMQQSVPSPRNVYACSI